MRRITHYSQWLISLVVSLTICGCAKEIQIRADNWSGKPRLRDQITVHVIGVKENDKSYDEKNPAYWSYDYWTESHKEGITEDGGYKIIKFLSLKKGEPIIIHPDAEEFKNADAEYFYIIADLPVDSNVKRRLRLPSDTKIWKDKVLEVVLTPDGINDTTGTCQ